MPATRRDHTSTVKWSIKTPGLQSGGTAEQMREAISGVGLGSGDLRRVQHASQVSSPHPSQHQYLLHYLESHLTGQLRLPSTALSGRKAAGVRGRAKGEAAAREQSPLGEGAPIAQKGGCPRQFVDLIQFTLPLTFESRMLARDTPVLPTNIDDDIDEDNNTQSHHNTNIAPREYQHEVAAPG